MVPGEHRFDLEIFLRVGSGSSVLQLQVDLKTLTPCRTLLAPWSVPSGCIQATARLCDRRTERRPADITEG